MDIRYLGAELHFVCEQPEHNTDENFDKFSDAVMDELCALEEVDSGIVDPDITATITNRVIHILMGVDADTERDALRLFSANVRTALHAAECVTAGWPSFKPADGVLPPASRVDRSPA